MEQSLTGFLLNNFREHFKGTLKESDLHLLHLARREEATISLYAFDTRSPWPVCEIKMVRTKEDAGILRDEYTALQRIRSSFADKAILASLPTPMGLVEWNGSQALILEFPSGKSLSRILAEDSLGIRPGRRARGTLLRCTDWLLRFQKITAGNHRLFDYEVFRSVENLRRLSSVEEAGKYHTMFDRLAHLKMEFEAPAVASHGRLGVFNIFESRAGVAVADWGHYCGSLHPFEDLLDLFASTNRFLTSYGWRNPLAFLAEPTSWLYGLFHEAIAALCSEFKLQAGDMRAYVLGYCLRDLERSLKSIDQKSLMTRLELIRTVEEIE